MEDARKRMDDRARMRDDFNEIARGLDNPEDADD
jgi:hypothetical protein